MEISCGTSMRNFLRRGKILIFGILFVGPPGTGKPHLAQAIDYNALKAGFLVLYRSIFDLKG